MVISVGGTIMKFIWFFLTHLHCKWNPKKTRALENQLKFNHHFRGKVELYNQSCDGFVKVFVILVRVWCNPVFYYIIENYFQFFVSGGGEDNTPPTEHTYIVGLGQLRWCGKGVRRTSVSDIFFLQSLYVFFIS